MPRKYVLASLGAHTLADGSPVAPGDEISFSAQQEKDNGYLIDGEVLVPKAEAEEQEKEG